MKRTLLTLLFSFALLPCLGQTAIQLLNQAAAKLQHGGIKASFEATTFRGLNPNGSTCGTIQVEGKKFKIQSNSITTWFNGKTQWSMQTGSDEVNVSTPTDAEIQKINPTAFINLYRGNCNYSLENEHYAGKNCKKITIVPKERTSFQRLVVLLDGSGNLQNIRMKDSKGNWIRFRINHLQTGLRLSNSTFEFNKHDYPKVTIIDLR